MSYTLCDVCFGCPSCDVFGNFESLNISVMITWLKYTFRTSPTDDQKKERSPTDFQTHIIGRTVQPHPELKQIFF